MNFQNLQVSHKDALAIITISRPEKLNALNLATIQELHLALKTAEEDSTIKVIILTGSGEKAFVAGADISEFASYSVKEGKKLAAQGQEILFDYMSNLATPVIAVINGYALGGGLELAMAAQIRIASENAKMGLPEVSLGVIPGYGGTQRLTQLIGKGRALEMVLTAGMIHASKALDFGLVNHIAPQHEIMPLAIAIAEKMMNNSPVAIASAIRAINACYRDGVNGFNIEIEEFGNCFGTLDFKEGTTAFLEKRKALFLGK